MQRTIRKGGKLISIEDYAFYCGAQGVPPDEGLSEIEHKFTQQKAQLEHASVPRQKPLQAVLERNKAHAAQIKSAWDNMLTRFGDHAPPVAIPWSMAILGPVALLVDTALTGPSLDALGISEPIIQYISAFALASLSAVIFHLAAESFESRRMDSRTSRGIRILAVFAIFGLLCWGILRGQEVAFGADAAGNTLGAFLHGNFFLAVLVFCFITVGSPMTAAFALGYAVPLIYDHRRWKKAKLDHQQLVATTTKTQSQLQAECDQLTHNLKQLGAEQREWQATFLQYHHRGTLRGGREEPLWLVVLKSVGVGLVALIVAVPLGMLFWPLFLLPVVAGVSAFVHFRRLRFTPTYNKFRRQEATHFAVVSSPRPELALPQPRTIDARLEDRT